MRAGRGPKVTPRGGRQDCGVGRAAGPGGPPAGRSGAIMRYRPPEHNNKTCRVCVARRRHRPEGGCGASSSESARERGAAPAPGRVRATDRAEWPLERLSRIESRAYYGRPRPTRCNRSRPTRHGAIARAQRDILGCCQGSNSARSARQDGRPPGRPRATERAEWPLERPSTEAECPMSNAESPMTK
jgi:hypothetical protein